MSDEPLRFGRPKATPAPAGSNRLVLVLLLGCGALALARSWFVPSIPDGVPIEVRGDVPRPGLHLVIDPTVSRAVAAAGGTMEGDPRPLRMGDRVEVHGATARVLPASDPLLVGLPLDPNTADAAAFAAVPGVGRGLADEIVADREAKGPFRSVADLSRVKGVGKGGLERLAPFVTVGEAPPLDLQTASAAELETLPGIGPVLAARIVIDRADRGPFRSVDELQRVEGIRAALIEQIRPMVMVGP